MTNILELEQRPYAIIFPSELQQVLLEYFEEKGFSHMICELCEVIWVWSSGLGHSKTICAFHDIDGPNRVKYIIDLR